MGLLMRRFRTVFALAFLGAVLMGAPFSPAAFAADAPKQESLHDSLMTLLPFVGKYPSDKILGHSFWDNKAMMKLVEKALGPERMKVFLTEPWIHGEEVPIEQQGMVLYESLCKAHDCTAEGIDFFVDLENGTFQACWRQWDNKAKASVDFWLSSEAAPKSLPSDSCADHQGFELLALFGQAPSQEKMK